MVRLKGAELKVLEAIDHEFQFQYCTIERALANEAMKEGVYFNSSMVRLKVLKVFNYGFNNTISIPVWYD